MYKTNLSEFIDQDLKVAYEEIIEFEKTGIMPYGIVQKTIDEERKIYSEIDKKTVCYYFCKEISRRWYQSFINEQRKYR